MLNYHKKTQHCFYWIIITHVHLRIIEFARKHYIIILTFPPHCITQAKAPEGDRVYRPLKTRYRIAMNEWMLWNPDKTVTIYQVAQFGKDAITAN